MKESDIIAAFDAARSGDVRDYRLGVARLLGVVVEPDDPPLPAYITLTETGPTRDNRWGAGFTTYDKTWRGLIEISLDQPINRYIEREKLGFALVDAYNTRGQRPYWRTGDPPSAGRYLIHYGLTVHVAEWDTGHKWRMLSGAWGPQTARWMPLPAPPTIDG